ncbi:MAG TPA: hypothetical protein VNU01_06805, partial [Egibacteraceae bacterium]|nr:hypothetical protein [Egibacteraceae bacterium]
MSRLLAVLLSCAVLVLPPAGSAGAQEPSPTPSEPGGECVEGDPDGYERVVDLTFPVSGGTRGDFTDTYDAPRSGGRVHQATDVMGRKLQGVHAVLPGEVVVATGIGEPMPSYGYYLKIRHDNGLESVYV